MDHPIEPRPQRRKSKSFHIDEPYTTHDNNHRRGRPRRDAPIEQRRASLDNDDDRYNIDRRQRRDRLDEDRSLERRFNQQQQQLQQFSQQQNHNQDGEFLSLEQQQMQQLQRRTVIHACDDKTGKCLFHPHITLRKKAIFGVLGGWVDVLRNCPECEEEDLKQLNSDGIVAGSSGYPTGSNSGGKQRSQSKEKRRRGTMSPDNRRDRTLSPNPRRPTVESEKNRDRTLSPIDKRRGRDRTLSPIDNRPPERSNEKPRGKRREYHAPPPLRHPPKERSRTLSPINRSRKRLGAFKKKEGYDSGTDEDKKQTKRQGRNNKGGKERYRYDNTNGDDYNHSNNVDEAKSKKKKNRLRGRQRPENSTAPPTYSPNPNPNDFISSYLTTGAVPNPRGRTKRRDSLGGLKGSGNGSDWKNLSDMAQGTKKLAEKVMRKKKKVKATTSAETENHSDDEGLDYLWKQNLVYDVDVDEKDDYYSKSQDELYTKSQPDMMQSSKPSRRRKHKVDLSDRTGDTDLNESWQTPRHKQGDDVPQSPRRNDEYAKNTMSTEDKHSYEKSWSADGIRVHAIDSTNDEEFYDHYGKALSMDGGIRVAAAQESVEAISREKSLRDSQHRQDVYPSSHPQKQSPHLHGEKRPEKQGSFSELQHIPNRHESQAVPADAMPESINDAGASHGVNSTNAFDMNQLKSVIHEYVAEQPSSVEAPEKQNDVAQAAVEHQSKNYSFAKDEDNKANTDEVDENHQAEQQYDEEEDQSEDEQLPTAPFPSKPDALPRVMSLGNLTIDLSALQATRPTKPDVKSVEVKKPAANPSGNSTVENSSDAGSEESIKLDRSALQRARPKKDPEEETVKTFPTTNLPWTGRFGESGMYTGLVNEQYQPHGRGTMIFDHGEIKKGHWNDGNFIRESGPYSDSEDDDEDDEADEDLSSSMMGFNTNIRSRSKSRDRGEPQPSTPPLATTYQIGDVAKQQDMIQEAEKFEVLIPKLEEADGAFIRRSDGKWTYAVVKLLENNNGNRAIRFTVNEKNSSKSYAEKYWFTHIRPMRATVQQSESEDRSKKCDPAGIISRQSSMGSVSNLEKEEQQSDNNRGTFCPPVQSRLFGSRGRSRSRSRARRGASLTPMRTLCSIDESDMEDEDSDEENDSFGGNNKVEVTGLHTMARTTYALRGIDP